MRMGLISRVPLGTREVRDRPEQMWFTTQRLGACALYIPNLLKAALLPPPGAVTAPALPSALTVPAEKSGKALATHRSKLADRGTRRVARPRHAALARTAAIDPAVAAPAASPAPAPRKIDPIGDLIRGLGLAGDREG